MEIAIDPHALVRIRERGADIEEIRETLEKGERFPAKRGRTAFRGTFTYDDWWEGKFYRNKQLEVIAAPQQNGWYVVTVITRFF